MLLSKSPKSSTYAQLGKQCSGKLSLQERRQQKQKSTGDLYAEILEQLDPQQKKYHLKTSNKKAQKAKSPPNITWQNRKKSYADLIIEVSPTKEKETQREPFQSLSKTRNRADRDHIQPQTPKYTTAPQMKKSTLTLKSFNLQNKQLTNHKRKASSAFLQQLDGYLGELDQTTHQINNHLQNEILGETIKLTSNVETPALASKLQQSQMKIKELKLKNYYNERQLKHYVKKQAKMRECLYEMMEQLKKVNNELLSQKKERKKLGKIVDSFALRQVERKTIGKHQLRLQHFENALNELTDNQVSLVDGEQDRICFQRRRSVGRVQEGGWNEARMSYIKRMLPSQCSQSQFQEE